VFTCATIVAIALVVPNSALAATAPTLDSPASGAKFTEGGTIPISWNGALQGDPDTLTRSFFRVELIKASDVPAGAQSDWTDVLENSIQTEPGEAVTDADLGVPDAGTWKWRVCAWGVVDDIVRNEIEQLPGGCTAARSFESTAAVVTSHAIGEMKMETKTQVDGQVNTVYVTRPSTPAPETTTPTPKVKQPVKPAEPLGPSGFLPLRNLHDSSSKEAPAVSLGSEGLNASQAADRHGLSGSIMNGLGSNLPLVPIPFWTLALLLACIPVARRWRVSVLGMFDWADGSIDGSGGLDHVIDDVAIVPHAQLVKIPSTTADGDAPAGNPRSAPDRGRRAA
jgi:hypothetical protein